MDVSQTSLIENVHVDFLMELILTEFRPFKLSHFLQPTALQGMVFM